MLGVRFQSTSASPTSFLGQCIFSVSRTRFAWLDQHHLLSITARCSSKCRNNGRLRASRINCVVWGANRAAVHEEQHISACSYNPRADATLKADTVEPQHEVYLNGGAKYVPNIGAARSRNETSYSTATIQGRRQSVTGHHNTLEVMSCGQKPSATHSVPSKQVSCSFLARRRLDHNHAVSFVWNFFFQRGGP